MFRGDGWKNINYCIILYLLCRIQKYEFIVFDFRLDWHLHRSYLPHATFSHESIEGISDHLESRFARAFYKSQKEKDEKVICTIFDLFCNLSLNDLLQNGYVKQTFSSFISRVKFITKTPKTLQNHPRRFKKKRNPRLLSNPPKKQQTMLPQESIMASEKKWWKFGDPKEPHAKNSTKGRVPVDSQGFLQNQNLHMSFP